LSPPPAFATQQNQGQNGGNNREVHRRHLTESKDDLIDQINTPIGR
jgi:hypothetical protein